MFDKIFKQAVISRKNNVAAYEERLRLEKEKKEREEAEKALKNVVRYMNVDYRDNNCSSELLHLIDKYEFEVLSYEQNLNSDDIENPLYYGEEPLEIYRCKKNNWTFEIKNYPDCDINEGIFSICNLKNISTGEKVDFYCDLGCRNTSDNKLNSFLNLTNFNSEKQYIKERYAKFFEIPSLLISKGVECKVIEEDYTLEGCGFLCEVNYSLSPLLNKGDKAKVFFLKFTINFIGNAELFVLKNKNDFRIETLCTYSHTDAKYKFQYNSGADIDELIRCMNCFYEQINKRIGYLEGDRYYSNLDIVKYFDSIMKDEKLHSKTNHYLVKFENCYGRYKNTANKYKGQEIYISKNLVINDAGIWAEGDEINNSHITIEYNTNKDDKNCILNIKNYIYKDMDSVTETSMHNGVFYVDLKPEFMIDEIEIKGSYLYIMEYLDKYIKTIFKIYEIIE